jgi:hypothetical protein
MAAQASLGVAQNAASTGPISRGWDYSMNAAIPNRFPDPGDLMVMLMRNIIDESQFTMMMRLHGYDESKSQLLKHTAFVKPGVAELITLYRRKLIDLTQYYDGCKRIGIEIDTAKVFLDASEYIPSAADAIRFAVREVYSADAQRLGLYEDYPGEQFTQAAAANGMTEQTAQQFWAAHWDLPSVTQVFEMLHRRLIDESQVDEYLRQADYSPPWRPLLREISYRPLTRVDVRRAYSLGIIGAEDVYNSYRDGGYNDTNAKVLTEFTVKSVSDENNGLTKSLITKSYTKGLVDRDTADQLLARIEIPEDIRTLELDLADYRIKLDELDAAEDAFIKAFLEGAMSLDEIRDAIRVYDVSETYVNKLINKLSLKKFQKRKTPTVADLKRWLNSKLIDQQMFVERLVAYGYSPADAMLYARDAVTDTTVAGE